MNQRMLATDPFSRRLSPLCLGALGLWTILVLGCGESTSTPSKTVTPPDSISGPGIETSQTPPSGGFELPSVPIPDPALSPEPAANPSGPAEKGGLEMPEGAQVPEDGGSTEDGENSESGGSSERSAAQPAGEPLILYASWKEIEVFAKSTGRVTIVDLWSLSCEPCLKEFPGLVELHRTMGSSVQCIAVDLDYDGRKTRPPEYYEERVSAFLRSVKAEGFPTYISQTQSDDVFASTDLNSIPAVLVYNASGELVKSFVDGGPSAGFTYEKDVKPFVEKIAG